MEDLEKADESALNSLLESLGLAFKLKWLLGALLADLDGFRLVLVLSLDVVDNFDGLVAAVIAVFKHEVALLQELLHLAVVSSLISNSELLKFCLLLGGNVRPVLCERFEDFCGLGVSTHRFLLGVKLVLDVSCIDPHPPLRHSDMLFEGASRQISISAFDAVGVGEVAELRKLFHLSLMPLSVLGRRIFERLLLRIGQLFPLLADSFGNFAE